MLKLLGAICLVAVTFSSLASLWLYKQMVDKVSIVVLGPKPKAKAKAKPRKKA
jgi:hypothetical protein